MGNATKVARLVLWELDGEARHVRDVIEFDPRTIGFAIDQVEAMLTLSMNTSSMTTSNTEVELLLVELNDASEYKEIAYKQHDDTLKMGTPPGCRKERPMAHHNGELVEVRKLLNTWFAPSNINSIVFGAPAPAAS
jgi:hypothetical protein